MLLLFTNFQNLIMKNEIPKNFEINPYFTPVFFKTWNWELSYGLKIPLPVLVTFDNALRIVRKEMIFKGKNGIDREFGITAFQNW